MSLYMCEYRECVDYFEKAIPIFQATGNRFEETNSIGLLGLRCGRTGEFSESFAYFDKAMAIARNARDDCSGGIASHLAPK